MAGAIDPLEGVGVGRQTLAHVVPIGSAECQRAASFFQITPEQAASCQDGEHRCPYCPWRNPLQTPSDGDRFTLANGKRIEIVAVFLRHAVEPVLEYSFIDWSRGHGGRKAYRRRLADWSDLAQGAAVLQHGRRPRRYCQPGNLDRYEQLRLAFEIANRSMQKAALKPPIIVGSPA